MWFVAIGVVLLLLRFAGVEPVAAWSWWQIAIPFVLAVLWWAWADGSGYTQRLAMDRMDEKKAARREKAMDALGQLDPKKKKRG